VVRERIGVLLAAAGASWEVEALRVVAAAPSGAVLLKRCVDLPDLLATATTGEARVAVVSAGIAGLDADSVAHLRRAGLGVVLVAEPGGPEHAGCLPGVFEVVVSDAVGSLGGVLSAAASDAVADSPARIPPNGAGESASPSRTGGSEEPDGPAASCLDAQGRAIAVWGPTGAPGRTTVAVGVAAELARRGRDVLLVDADAYGGAVAQHLGVLDEVSGLLSAVRLANAGRLDVPRLASAARTVAPGLRVLSGLPRADRWVEVRGVAFDAVVQTGRALCSHVVLDLGFDLEQADQAFGSSAPQRNLMTLAGLDHADEILVVGSADPVGLARLARGLVELPELVPAAPTHVVVNRMRTTLGWGEREVSAMVEGFVTPAGMHFLPHDPVAADRALVSGRPLPEVGESALRSAMARLADRLDHGDVARSARSRGGRSRGRLRRRRAGRDR